MEEHIIFCAALQVPLIGGTSKIRRNRDRCFVPARSPDLGCDSPFPLGSGALTATEERNLSISDFVCMNVLKCPSAGRDSVLYRSLSHALSAMDKIPPVQTGTVAFYGSVSLRRANGSATNRKYQRRKS